MNLSKKAQSQYNKERNETMSGLFNIVKYGKGNEREIATQKFLRYYFPCVKGILSSKLSQEEAEDLSSDLLLDLISSKIEIQGNFSGYLFRAALNRKINYLRKRVKLVYDQEERISETSPLAEALIDLDAEKKEVDAKKVKFYEEHRKRRGERVQGQFQMMLQKVPYKEIAAAYGLSEGTIKSNIHRIRRKEGKILKEFKKKKSK